MLTWHAAHRFAVAFSAALAVLLTVSHVHAQRRKRAPPVSEELTGGERNPIRKQQPGAKESLEADVSARTVTVKTNFQGVEIVVFGAVDNSQQPTPSLATTTSSSSSKVFRVAWSRAAGATSRVFGSIRRR